MQFIERLTSWIKRRKIKRRRRRLVAAYAKVGRAKHDLGPGFSPTMYAYDQLFSDGILVSVETDTGRQIVWTWPDERNDDDVRWTHADDVAAEAAAREVETDA